MQPRLRPRLADFRQRLDVIPMRVRDENVPELNLLGGDAIEHRLRVESGVEQRRVAGDFVPDEITIHGQPFARRGDTRISRMRTKSLAQAASRWRWLQVLPDSSDQWRELREIDFREALPDSSSADNSFRNAGALAAAAAGTLFIALLCG